MLQSLTEDLRNEVKAVISSIKATCNVPLSLRATSLQHNYAREIKEMELVNKSSPDVATDALSISLFINMLNSAPNLGAVGALVTSVFQRLTERSPAAGLEVDSLLASLGVGGFGGMGGLAGMRGRMDRATGMGESDIRRQQHLETFQNGLVQFFSECDFSNPCLTSDQDLLSCIDGMNVESRPGCLLAILQNKRFVLLLNLIIIWLISPYTFSICQLLLSHLRHYD